MFLPGKLDSRPPLVATTAGGSSSLFYVRDRLSNRNLLVDTGAEISVLPPSAKERYYNAPGPFLRAANGSKIKTYGKRPVTLDLPSRRYPWTFVLADVSQPL